MDANRPRSTLEVPRRHKGTALEAPKPGPLHDHAPALSESDFDRSKYMRAEYVPASSTANDYNRASYDPTPPPASVSPASVSKEEARRADPTSWRSDPSASKAPSGTAPTGLTPSDPLRDDLSTLRYDRKNSALDPSRLRRASKTSRQRKNPTGEPQSWQQAMDELTSDPDSGPLVRGVIAFIIAALIMSVGNAILGRFFWALALALTFAAFKNSDDSEGMTPWVRGLVGRIHPSLGKMPGYLMFLIALGAFCLLMLFTS